MSSPLIKQAEKVEALKIKINYDRVNGMVDYQSALLEKINEIIDWINKHEYTTTKQ